MGKARQNSREAEINTSKFGIQNFINFCAESYNYHNRKKSEFELQNKTPLLAN